MGNRTGRLVLCTTCSKEFYRAKWQIKDRNFCSRDCANKGQAVLLTKKEYGKVICPECNVEFLQKWNGPKKFCSTSCSAKYNLAVINSEKPTKRGTNPERDFANLLNSCQIVYIFQKALPWKKGWKKWYDFYLPDFNYLVEVDGTYWHGKGLTTGELNKQQWQTRVNDRLKNYLAKKRGFNLLRIWSDEVKGLSESSLKKLLNNKTVIK